MKFLLQPVVGNDHDARQEFEYIPSKVLSVYDRSQKKYADIFNTNVSIVT